MNEHVESLRRIWTPEREIEEYFSDLSPATELDSLVRDCLSRIVDKEDSITLDITDPVPEFEIQFSIVHTPPPNSRKQLTIWKA